MNPLTNVKNIEKLNKYVLDMGLAPEKSWHQQYKDSAWIFIGGLQYDLTEGDIICVFSQFGEVVNINLVRDKKTGKTKGFCFLCYEDQRSTILAVDNLNGIKLTGRIIRVDHIEEYKVPKMKEEMDDKRKKLFLEGCAPKPIISEEDEIKIIPEPVPMEFKVKKEKKSKRKNSSSSSSDKDSRSKKSKRKK